MIPTLASLHEEFIDQARRPMSFGGPPIAAQRPVPIIVPIEKWTENTDGLTKKFVFRRSEDRTRFVIELMEYEEHVQHHAEMLLNEGEVSLRLITKDIDKVTERDREYKTFADALFKDIVYSP